MKEFKLNPDRISEYTKRTSNRVLRTIIFVLIGISFLTFLMTQQKGFPKESIGIIFTSHFLAIIILGLIYLNNSKLSRLCAENLRIVVDDVSISRIIDLENEPRMNFMHKYGYKRAKHISGGYYTRIEFSDMKSTEHKNGDLWIYSTESNPINGKYILVLPRELNGFKEVEKLIVAK